MSKRSRTLLLSAVALVALAGILLALLFLLPEKPSNGSNESTDTSVVLLDKTVDKTVSVVSAELKFQNESFKVLSTQDNVLYVEGYEALPLNLYTLNELGETLLSVTASKKVTDTADNLTDFGFSTAKGCLAAISVTYSDKSTYAFEIGNLSPNGEEYYLREKDSQTIYLVDSAFVEKITAKSTSYLSHTLFTLPEAEKEDDQVAIKTVSLGGTIRKNAIVLHNNGRQNVGDDNLILSGFYISEPYFHAVNDTSPLISLATFSAATATDIVKLFPSVADLEKYGLAKPYSRCNVELAIQRSTTTGVGDDKKTTVSFHNAFENTLLLGNKTEDGNYYALSIVEDEVTPIVYIVTPEAVPWAELQYDDVADTMLFFQYIYNLEGMDITVDGKTHNFHFAHDADAESVEKKLTVTAGGKQYDTTSFRTLYSWLISIYRSGSIDKKPTGEPLLTFTIRPLDKTEKTSTISLYSYSAGKCIALHDTGEIYLVDSKNVNLFVSNYRRYVQGEIVNP
ncbi:MAG: DUF4340 domain-containing protein [Clostridia bacterium]|nr:DUF4340 domain-containing protein [Clostridia bacterium]